MLVGAENAHPRPLRGTLHLKNTQYIIYKPTSAAQKTSEQTNNQRITIPTLRLLLSYFLLDQFFS